MMGIWHPGITYQPMIGPYDHLLDTHILNVEPSDNSDIHNRALISYHLLTMLTTQMFSMEPWNPILATQYPSQGPGMTY